MEKYTIDADIHQEVGSEYEVPDVEFGKDDYFSQMVHIIKSEN